MSENNVSRRGLLQILGSSARRGRSSRGAETHDHAHQGTTTETPVLQRARL